MCSWPLTFWTQNQKLRQTVEYYYRAKFQVTAFRGFHFIVLTYTPTPHIHTLWHSDRCIRAPSAWIMQTKPLSTIVSIITLVQIMKSIIISIRTNFRIYWYTPICVGVLEHKSMVGLHRIILSHIKYWLKSWCRRRWLFDRSRNLKIVGRTNIRSSELFF